MSRILSKLSHGYVKVVVSVDLSKLQNGFLKVLKSCDMDLFFSLHLLPNATKIFKKDEHGDFEISCHGFVNVHSWICQMYYMDLSKLTHVTWICFLPISSACENIAKGTTNPRVEFILPK